MRWQLLSAGDDLFFFFWSSTYTARLKLHFKVEPPFLKVWIRPWVVVKFGINTTLVVLEIVNFIYPHFQYNTRGIYPKFHCYPCYY